MLNYKIEMNSAKIVRNIDELPDKVDGYIHAVVAYQAGKATAWMKTTAKWRDRTGNARSGLSVDVGWKPQESHSMTFFYRVAYGIFLEVRWAGKFAIIGPAIQKFGPETMRMLDKMFDKLAGGAP